MATAAGPTAAANQQITKTSINCTHSIPPDLFFIERLNTTRVSDGKTRLYAHFRDSCPACKKSKAYVTQRFKPGLRVQDLLFQVCVPS